mmetsp:Transcript_10908/g.16349  ORF Transcript_10908/g.16349 Transcript_10908/m.16349 type:complete len:203 (+) Transcript_10908:70-678(+)
MSWDRGAPTPVVQNAHQAKQEPDKGPPWMCTGCFHMGNVASATHCMKCGTLRPEERLIRMQARAVQGMGRGGGFFERNDPADRRQSDENDEFDEFGRRRSKKAAPASPTGASAAAEVPEAAPAAAAEITSSSSAKAEAAGKDGASSAPQTKAERQKAALARLRNPKKKELSPPRTRVYRDKSSRSRSREQKRGGYIFSGGIR